MLSHVGTYTPKHFDTEEECSKVAEQIVVDSQEGAAFCVRGYMKIKEISMSKDQVDLNKFTNEDWKREYDLIQRKESKLPASQRKIVVEIVESTKRNNNE